MTRKADEKTPILLIHNYFPKNKIKGGAFVSAIFVLSLGFIFRNYPPLSSQYCSTENMCMSVIGDPGFALGKWLILTSIILYFAHDGMLGHWATFAVLFLFCTGILIVMAPVSPFWGKDAMAILFGMILFGITSLWVLTYALIVKKYKRHSDTNNSQRWILWTIILLMVFVAMVPFTKSIFEHFQNIML